VCSNSQSLTKLSVCTPPLIRDEVKWDFGVYWAQGTHAAPSRTRPWNSAAPLVLRA